MNKIKRHGGLVKLILMIILSCVTQVVTLMKSSIVAGAFGASAEMDSFSFANSAATFIFSFVIAGVATVVIPCYVKKANPKNTDSFLTFIFSCVVVVSILVLSLRTPIVSVITRRDTEFVDLSGKIMVVLIVSNLFSIFTSTTSAYFQYKEEYNIPKIITLISQIFVVALLIMLKNITIMQYAIIFGGGIVLNSFVDLLFALKSGWRYKPSFALKDPETKKLIQIFIPVLFSTGVYQLSLMIDSSIASQLDMGNVTVLSYANQISSMINTLLVSNLLIYFYPKLVKDIEQLKDQRSFWEKTYFFHAIICLVVAEYAVVGREGVSLLFEHGKFDAKASYSVFVMSLIYISAQQIGVVRDLIYRCFYAFGNTKTPTFNSVLATVANIVFSLTLVKFIGVYGIVVGTALSSVVSLALIMIQFKKKYGFGEPIWRILFQYIKSLLITAVSILVPLVTKNLFAIQSKIITIFVFGIEVVVVYGVLTLIFNKKIKKIASSV